MTELIRTNLFLQALSHSEKRRILMALEELHLLAQEKLEDYVKSIGITSSKPERDIAMNDDLINLYKKAFGQEYDQRIEFEILGEKRNELRDAFTEDIGIAYRSSE